MNLEALALIVNIVIACIAGVGALRRASAAGAGGLFVLAVAAAVNSACYLLYHSQAYGSQGDFWVGVIYLSAAVAASAVLVLAMQQSLRRAAIHLHRLILLAIVPVVTQVLFWVPSLRNQFFQLTTTPAVEAVFTAGPWGRIQAAYVYGLVAAALILSISVYFQRRRSLLDPALLTAIGCAFPVVALALDLAG